MDKLFDVSSPDKNDLALKFAIFNGLGIVIVLLSIAAAIGVFIILQPFIKPLLWALLCGSALFPLKEILSRKFQEWIEGFESPSTSWSNVILSPVVLVLHLSDTLGQFLIVKSYTILRPLTLFFICFVFYLYIPNSVVNFFRIVTCGGGITLIFFLNLFQNVYLVISLVCTLLLSLKFLWRPEIFFLLSLYSFLTWMAITAWISNQFEVIREAVFILINSVTLISYFYTKSGTILDESKDEFQENEVEVEGEVQVKEKEPSKISRFECLRENISSICQHIVYIKWLALVCLSVQAVNLPLFLYVLLVLILIFVLKEASLRFGLLAWLETKLKLILQNCQDWSEERKEAIFPYPVVNLVKASTTLLRLFLSAVRQYCDAFASLTVISGLIFFVSFSGLFLLLQAYKESVYFVQVGGHFINTTIVHNPELSHLLPVGWDSTFESALDNAYIYVRQYLADFVNSTLEGKGISEHRRLELEKNTLELWDRVYQAWVAPLHDHSMGPIVTVDAVMHSYNSLIEMLQKTPEVMSFSSLGGLLSENMSTLTSGLDSLWSLLKSNTTLLITVVSTLFSFIFGSGMSIINFTFNMVVFITALFYLLNTSRDLYKPVEFITRISPKYGNKLALAVENASREVLAASVKLSVFYGMWTWLIHTLFQSNFVYMPAVFAAILAVVPILGTYWVCLPACLDLWFMQGNEFLALGLLIAQVLPTMIVDSIVYNEIQGGHPYLTGLSVAGGLFWLGFEGALVGPLGLCFLFVLVNMTSAITHSKPDK